MATLFRIVTIGLGLLLKCARWIPKILTRAQKKSRIFAAKENLYLHSLDPEFFENQIVTGDETYIHLYEPETKRQSMQWLPPGSDPPKKVIRKLSAKKVMALVFWDNAGVLLVKFFRKGRTMTGAVYAEILKKLQHSGEEGMWDDGIFLLHDNAPSHTSKISKLAIQELGFTELTHPPYSPDLAPSDFFLFPNLKKDLRKQAYTSDLAVEKATMAWLKKKSESFYAGGISRLKHRWEKCVKVKGEYVEK
jgi:histone-lysine N-methyltransferase SETMAR